MGRKVRPISKFSLRILMGRKLRPISKFALRKCDNNNAEVSTCLLPIKKKRKEKGNYAEEDCTGPLPDEILVCILSRLTMKEAARTSVLARRWRYLWTFFTGSLNFDCSRRVFDLRWILQPPISMLHIERLSFVGWVNKVLKSHQGPVIDELKVCFHVDSENFKCDIDSWVKFAIEKSVNRLQLDLTTCIPGYNLNGRYSFPSHLLNCSSFGSLTALCLIYVDVNGEVIEYLLANCSLLEVLRIVDSTCLVSLKVCEDQSLKLKYLEISRCHNLVNLEISAVNLVSFEYVGPNIGVSFKNVPRLVEVSFGGMYNNFIMQNLSQLSSALPQLETLAMGAFFTNELLPFRPPDNNLEFSNLKHLELEVSLEDVYCFAPCTYLLKASPLLCDLTLKLKRMGPSFKNVRKLMIRDHPHQCLKVVKLVGFQGFTADVEVVMYFVENAVLLEKIIVEPYMPSVFANSLELKVREAENHRLARERAKDMRAKLPSSIEFVLV